MQVRQHLLTLAIAAMALGSASVCSAQPLVTEGLVVYYSFDSIDEDGIWKDGSPNGLNGLTQLGAEDANGDGLKDVRLDTNVKVRGAGSAWFDTDVNVKEDYIAVCDPVHDYAANCEKADTLKLIPTNGFTVAAWVQVSALGSDHSVWQSRSDNGGFTHTQIQGNGNVRMTLRGDLNSENLVTFNEPPGGTPVEPETWVHWVGTYERINPNAAGSWAFYFNGSQVAGGDANGNVAGTELEVLGNWGQGAFIGMVPDFARQLSGHMDEFYLFNRALTESEVGKLYNVNVNPGVPGDFNADGLLTNVDIDLLGADVRTPSGNKIYDVNKDGVVNNADRDTWVNVLKKTYYGDADLDGQFNSGDFVVVFQKGQYEDGIAGNSKWADGDWNNDTNFDSGDFVVAFQQGGYEKGPRAAVSAVPEPSSLTLVMLGSLALLSRRRK